MDEVHHGDSFTKAKPDSPVLPSIAPLHLPSRQDPYLDASGSQYHEYPVPDSACEILPEVPEKDQHYEPKTPRAKYHFSYDLTDYDLRPPPPRIRHNNAEYLVERLFSVEHLEVLLEDANYFHRFKSFLKRYRPQMVFTLMAYLESQKALTAVHYANALAGQLSSPSHDGSSSRLPRNAAIIDTGFEDATQSLLDELVQEALPAYITHRMIATVTECLVKDVAGGSTSTTRDLIQGLAEVYCISDPKQPDNPIVFASEEFHNMTQYGHDYVFGRNCRFLQGPQTSRTTVDRISNAVTNGHDVNEVILNYRRDGSPFLNLIMTAPLIDDRGDTRYFIGAQIDITYLLESSKMLSSFKRLLHQDAKPPAQPPDSPRLNSHKPSVTLLRDLRGLLNGEEVGVVAHRHETHSSVEFSPGSSRTDFPTRSNTHPHRRFVGLDRRDEETWPPQTSRLPLKQMGVYQNYLLVRPYPSLRIIFTSASLRIPGLSQSRLMDRIGGPQHVRDEIEDAFAQGIGVTARIDWLSQSPSRGSYTPLHDGSCINTTDPNSIQENRPRWIHCTPLFGSDSQPGAFMVVMLAEEEPSGSLVAPNRDLRLASSRQIRHQDDHAKGKGPIGEAITSSTPAPRSTASNLHADHLAADKRRASQTPTYRLQPPGDVASATRNAGTTIANPSVLSSARSPSGRLTTQRISHMKGKLVGINKLKKSK